MAAITQAELSVRIKTILDAKSKDPLIDTEVARQHFADEFASAVNDFVVGRLTEVVGVQSGTGTAIGTIQ